MNLLGCYQSIN